MLKGFYQSKKWTRLIECLKLERLNADGQLICEYCGEPIVKKYDCIGHHKIELTDENVEDASISLNPDNIALIHFKCHNKIHERFGGFRQKVFLVYGAPCSGKSTWVAENAHKDDLILDMDRLWESISLSDRLHKPSRLTTNVFLLRDCLLDQIRTRTGKWRNAFVIGGYPLRSDRSVLCDLLNAETVFIEADKAECLSRAETDEWRGYVEAWFADFVP